MDFITHYWADIAQLTIQLGLVQFGYRLYKKWRQKSEAHDNAMRSLLRAEIIHTCHRADEKGFIEVYNLENLDDMYTAYHALGGNGAIKTMYEQAKGHHIVTGMGEGHNAE